VQSAAPAPPAVAIHASATATRDLETLKEFMTLRALLLRYSNDHNFNSWDRATEKYDTGVDGDKAQGLTISRVFLHFRAKGSSHLHGAGQCQTPLLADCYRWKY
jgi:hypothetical protein